MDKIYQVFISSTYEDLQDERKEVMEALLELDCMPAGMELFPASNEDQWSLIKRVIDTCDYYILIIGGRYGSENSEGISYTQMEFQYALDRGKPIISFLPKNPESIPVGKCENDQEKKNKLEKFKEIAKKKLVKYWDTPENLGSFVSRSMIKLIRDFPAEGWVKSKSAKDEQAIKEIARLQKENLELKQKLREVSTEAPKGTDDLAQGEDTITVKYSLTVRGSVRFQTETETFGRSEAYSWNTIFGSVAPTMINECTEDSIKECLEEYILKNSIYKDIGKDCYVCVEQESFDLIKIQLRALGYIELGKKKRADKDNNTYWGLTPYGDYMMTKILARKKHEKL